MALGDYLSNMFLGTAYGSGEGGGKASQELWKIYQQAYNVKPVWNGKSWVIPPGAIQRFQMLLPLINAQMQGERAGKGAEGNYGMVGALSKEVFPGLYKEGLKKLGGWGDIMDKIGSLWDYKPSGEYNLEGGSPADFYQADAQDDSPIIPQMDINMPTVDPNVSEDWWSNAPDTTDMNWLDSIPIDDTSYYDYTENFW